MSLQTISANPVLRNYAQDAAQRSVRRVANLIAPTVEVPTLYGKYKVYDAKHRYKIPITKRAIGGKATRIGFDATDATYSLEPNALDFPIDNLEKLEGDQLMNMAQYGADLIADAASLAHEKDVIDTALANVGTPVDSNFTSASVDPIDVLDEQIETVKKAAKNGAGIVLIFGLTAWRRFKSNAKVIARYTGTAKAQSQPSLEDVRQMLLTNPVVDYSDMVNDTAVEGAAESIGFLMSNQILIFASNPTPNTMDPSFMKTFRLRGKWMVPGTYQFEDGRGEALKMDWTGEVKVTNTAAIKMVNANAA